MPKYAKKDLVGEPLQEWFGTGGGTGYTQLLLIEHTFLLMEAYGKPILIDVSLSFCNHFVSRKEEEGGTPLLFFHWEYSSARKNVRKETHYAMRQCRFLRD